MKHDLLCEILSMIITYGDLRAESISYILLQDGSKSSGKSVEAGKMYVEISKKLAEWVCKEASDD